MMLKKFFRKTIRAAKESAQQMYEDDFVILETGTPVGTREEPDQASESANQVIEEGEYSYEDTGVKFERSDSTLNSDEAGASPTLKAIRKYAETQTLHEVNEPKDSRTGRSNGLAEKSYGNPLRRTPRNGATNTVDLYSRQNIRMLRAKNEDSGSLAEKKIPEQGRINANGERGRHTFSSELNRSLEETDIQDDAAFLLYKQMREEIDTMNNRIDKIEELLQILLQDLGVTGKKAR